MDCLLLLRKGELSLVEWEEMLRGIRERDPRAASALFEEKGARLYQAFYLASGDYGAARSQAKEAFSSLLRRIRQAPEDTVDPARLEQWLQDLTKQRAALPAPSVPASLPAQPPAQEKSPLDLCLASFPEQPLPPETQRLLASGPSAGASPAQAGGAAPPPQAAPCQSQQAAALSGPCAAGPEEIHSDFLSHYQETARRQKSRSRRIWPWLLLAALAAVLLGLIWAIAGLCMSLSLIHISSPKSWISITATGLCPLPPPPPRR